jgi:hypothetical protein
MRAALSVMNVDHSPVTMVPLKINRVVSVEVSWSIVETGSKSERQRLDGRLMDENAVDEWRVGILERVWYSRNERKMEVESNLEGQF